MLNGKPVQGLAHDEHAAQVVKNKRRHVEYVASNPPPQNRFQSASPRMDGGRQSESRNWKCEVE